MNKIQDLNGKWNCRGISPRGQELSLTGSVPGTVHLDLMQAGMIEDIFREKNAEKYHWIDQWSWEYSRTFEINEINEELKYGICFEGLDVYCDIYLNDVKIGSADNMFIAHSYPVGTALKKGENFLKVVFFSPDRMTVDCEEREAAFSWRRVYTRRIQCTYGWDWTDRFVTCGIIRNVYLYTEDKTEIRDVYVHTDSIDAFGAQVKIDVNFQSISKTSFLRTRIVSPDGVCVFEDEKLIAEPQIYKSVDIESPQLWYPNGYGEQKLYTICLEVWDDGNCVGKREFSFGIRKVKILQRQDLEGSVYYQKCLDLQKEISSSEEIVPFEQNKDFFGFVVIVNDIPIMCKGANWVPCEPFKFQGNDGKIKNLLNLAKNAGMNMLRVWGGGLFEEDIFYEECDRLGILVVQDFLMACGDYPCEQESFLEHLRQEAVYAAVKLRNHACLTWWNGDNENGAAGHDNDGEYQGRRGAMEVIVPVLHLYDPARCVLPSSPYGGELYGSLTSGTTHNTQFMVPKFRDIRQQDMNDFEDYFDRYLARFNCEEPIIGAPSLTSLGKFMTEEQIFGEDTEIWKYHTKNNPTGEFLKYDLFDYLEIIAQKILGDFKDPEDRVFKLQYIQYELVRKSMEIYRRNKWFSAGILYWMFNDIWPASGWSLVDYYGMPKAGYYAFRQYAEPVILSVKRTCAGYDIYVCNDFVEEQKGKVSVTVDDFAGRKHRWQFDYEIEGNSSAVVYSISADDVHEKADKDSVMICSLMNELGKEIWSGRYYMSKPANVKYPKAHVERIYQDDEQIVLKADAYVPVVRLEGECIFSDNYFALNAGEEKTVRIQRNGSYEADIRVDYECWRS